MSDEKRRAGDIERYSSRQLDSSRTGNDRNHSPASRTGDELGTGNSGSTDSSSIAEAVSGTLSRPRSITVESQSAKATLVGVPSLDIEPFVYSHQADGGDEHHVALFDVENTSDRPIRWQSSKTQFIGDDDYTYQPARISLDPAKLGPGCHTRQVELPPGKRARVVTLAEAVPPGVEIVEVVHSFTSQSGPGGRERLVFSLG